MSYKCVAHIDSSGEMISFEGPPSTIAGEHASTEAQQLYSYSELSKPETLPSVGVIVILATAAFVLTGLNHSMNKNSR